MTREQNRAPSFSPCPSHKFSIPCHSLAAHGQRPVRLGRKCGHLPGNVLMTRAFRAAAHRAASTPEPASALTKAGGSEA